MKQHHVGVQEVRIFIPCLHLVPLNVMKIKMYTMSCVDQYFSLKKNYHWKFRYDNAPGELRYINFAPFRLKEQYYIPSWSLFIVEQWNIIFPSPLYIDHTLHTSVNHHRIACILTPVEHTSLQHPEDFIH